MFALILGLIVVLGASLTLLGLLEVERAKANMLKVRIEGLSEELQQFIKESEKIRQDLMVANSRLLLAQGEQGRESAKYSGMD